MFAVHEQTCGRFPNFSTADPKKFTATEHLICSVLYIKLLPEAFGNIEEKGDGYC